MAIENKDFLEIDFSAKVKNGEIFDTTRKEDSKVLNVKEDSLKPLIISVGSEMVVKGLDSDLIGKEIGKDYEIEISPENAFGKRDASLVQMIPMRNFSEQNVYPQKGMQFSFDGRLARILSVSGGRVLVDFNNLLAGKDIVYNYKILRKVEDKKEQFDALQDFFFRRKFECEVRDKKINVKVDKEFYPLFDLMKKRFEDILELEISMELLGKKA